MQEGPCCNPKPGAFGGGTFHHPTLLLDDSSAFFFTADSACELFSQIFVSCVEANTMLIHTCLQEVWQLRDRIARLIWFRRGLFIGSRLAQRASKNPSTE